MFITLEGIDGCGKSTQARLLVEWLSSRTNVEKVIHTFEPGGGRKAIREILLGGGLSLKAELLLFLADRLEHADKIIRPAIATGKFVVCDRYYDSTLAYQSARGVPKIEIENFFAWCEFPIPTLTLFFDIPVEMAAERLIARGGIKDNFESEGLEFMRKLSECYGELARTQTRFVRVDASRGVDDIASEVREIVGSKFEL